VVTADQVRAFAVSLPRSSEAFVRGRVKFRVKRIVFLALSRDGATMGCGFPREWRAAVIEAEPQKFSFPSAGDMRYQWIHVDLSAIDVEEMEELVENAWAMCVPQSIADEYLAARGT
jgi:hypothetical protein